MSTLLLSFGLLLATPTPANSSGRSEAEVVKKDDDATQSASKKSTAPATEDRARAADSTKKKTAKKKTAKKKLAGR